MKRFLFLSFLLLTYIISSAQIVCSTAEYRQQFLRDNPGLASKVAAIETFTQNFQKGKNLIAQRLLMTILVSLANIEARQF